MAVRAVRLPGCVERLPHAQAPLPQSQPVSKKLPLAYLLKGVRHACFNDSQGLRLFLPFLANQTRGVDHGQKSAHVPSLFCRESSYLVTVAWSMLKRHEGLTLPFVGLAQPGQSLKSNFRVSFPCRRRPPAPQRRSGCLHPLRF